MQHDQPCLPDYDGGSIVNLMSTIVTSFGGERSRYPPLRHLPGLESRNVVLLVVDGLGYDYLVAHGARTLNAYLAGPITSVFPSTTASAITTFLTGTAPQQHGLTGWHMYFHEIGGVAAVLPFRMRHDGAPLSLSVDALLAPRPVTARIPVRTHVVSPVDIAHSAFNTAHLGPARLWPYASLDQMRAAIREAIATDGGRNYVYAYWPELDRLAHLHGIGSDATDTHLGTLDSAFERLLDAMAGTATTVLVTADHGFVNAMADGMIDVDAHPALQRGLRVPLCGEPRVAYCYVHAETAAEFLACATSRLAPHADIVESRRLIDHGWFGFGPPHPRLHARIGDYTLVMRGAATIHDSLPGEKRPVTIGVHGGTSRAEMHVPLIVAET
jgi:hypothetical protein